MRHTPQQTAFLIALVFHRAKVKRARVSEKTFRRLAGRTKLRRVFIRRVIEELDDLGLILVEIERGWGLMPLSLLDGAPAVTAAKYMPDEIQLMKQGRDLDFEKIAKEIGVPSEPGEDESAED